MNYRFFIAIIVTGFLYNHMVLCDAVITMFLKPYPTIALNNAAQETAGKLKNPGKIAHHQVHSIVQKDMVSGLFSTYAGYLNTSDTNGQIVFPRRHLDPFVYLLITDRITPIMMAGNTIHHWELEEKTAAAMYKVELQQDPDTGLWFWNTQLEPLPENNVIPLEAIILFAKPKNVYVPVGITLAKNNTNLILPDIYLKKGIKIYPSTLYVLNVRQFFGPIMFMYQKRPAEYSSHVVP